MYQSRLDFATASNSWARGIVNLGVEGDGWEARGVGVLRPKSYQRAVAGGRLNGDEIDDLVVGYLSNELSTWRTGVDVLYGAEDAVHGVSQLGYASPNMLGYFPRVIERDKTEEPARPAAGAFAGLLCKLDRTFGPWQDLDQKAIGLQRGLLPVADYDDDDCHLLNRAGLNVFAKGPDGRSRLHGSVTLGRGSEAHREFASLPVRRFCLQLVNAIAKATRWAVFEPDDATLVKRIRVQVLAYFYRLADLGAFADQRFVVECDAGVSHRADSEQHGVTILLVFHPTGSVAPISLTLHLTAAGCRVGSTAFAPSIENCA